MKKMMLRLVMLLMAALLACAPAMAEVDAFTSASVTDFYGDNALTGDELMNAINSFSGFYLLTNGEGLAVYAATPAGGEEDELYAVSGARMRFTVVTDSEVLAALEIEEGGSTILCEITETKSLG